VTNLLQSIAMGKMTGRLHIDPDSGPVEIFFEMGMPVHALSRLSSGEECFLEVVALHNGSFVFEPNLKTDTRSITHALDSLILKGVQLVDCQSVIEGAGVKSNSIVHRAQQGLGEAEFEDKVRQGAPLDMTIQKRFYITIDERLSIKQIADSLKLLRSEWVPIIANFIKVDLASFSDSDPNAKRLTVARKRIDPIVVEQFAHHLKKPDTGAFTFPAFLYFLEQEFLRFTHHQAPVSVILLDIRLNKAGAPAPAPRTAMNAQMMNPQTVNPQAVAHVVRCMVPAKRELDLIAHYEGQSLAILLPNTEWREAADVARRILAALSEARITTGLEKLNVSGVLGVACLPKDVDNPGELLAAAELAKERASTAPDGLRLFSDLS
jgi:GGDEF domain-containing protein